MNSCPTTQVLEERLSGNLGETPAAGVDEHVQACPRCQAWLAERTEHAELRGFAIRAGEVQPTEGALDLLLRRLRELPRRETDRDTPPVANATLPLAPPQHSGDLGVLGHYRIEAELGRGGMGIVYRARDESLQRTVAIKVLRPERADALAQERLLREAQIAASFRHDHVVTVHAIATPADGPAYLVMEYLDGPTLAAMIREKGRLPPADAAGIVVQAADGLEAAHAAGLIHRDVKPSNIILDTQTKRVKILDFGLARLPEAGSALTQEGVVAGTPTYMSPEQIQGRTPLDGRADVYGLGVTLYEALTGEVPFRGTPTAVLRQVLEDEPRSPRTLNDAVPRDLETICLKAMAKEPQRRYPAAKALADDLRRWLGGEPIHARAVRRREKAWRWCRRNPAVAGLSLAVVVILLAGMAGTTWQAWIARENARRADNARMLADEARILAEQRRDLAEGSQLVALHAVDYFYTKVSEEQLLHHPQLQPLRRALLGAALASYRNFVQVHQDNPHLVLRAAFTAYRLAGIVDEIGSASDSESAYLQAITWLDKALESNPVNTDLRVKRAESYMHLGMARQRRGALNQALVSLQRAAALCEEILAEDPMNRQRLGDLCACYGNIANLHTQQGETDRALPWYEKIQSHLQSMAQAEPANLGVQRTLGVNTHNLAMAYSSLGQKMKAFQWFEQARDIRRHLADGESPLALYTRDLARTETMLAELCQQVGKASQAPGHYREAINGLEKVVKSNPAGWEYRENLANVYLNLGSFLANEKKDEEALRAYVQGAAAARAVLAIDSKALQARQYLATIVFASGSLHLRRDQSAAALPLLKEAVALEKELIERFGQANRHDLRARACRAYGTALYLVGQQKEALIVLAEGVEHARLAFQKEPAQPSRRGALSEQYQHLAQRLRQSGQPARAAELTLRRAELWPRQPQELFAAACELALAVSALSKDSASENGRTRQKYVDEAVALLRRAVALDAKWRQQLPTRTELEGLRGEPVFRDLLDTSR